ncbi:MAG TPA: helix-hairpin-helix domain-containing protein [Candidatus Bathyarchaeia archaeon]|nr:helix-hairpin-helix domain-containing protein [Candidatus Bathyarchaeia archaeon]
MRSDYILYAVAIIFFVITGISLVAELSELQRNVSVVATIMLGILCAGLGFILRPRSTTTATVAPAVPLTPPTLPEPAQTTTTETTTVTEEKTEAVVETPLAVAPAAPPSELTKVKGIGEKRSKQLTDLGINTVEELSNASAKEIASKLQISPKITAKWIANAKELKKES